MSEQIINNVPCETCLGLHTKLGDMVSCVNGIFNDKEIQSLNLSDDLKIRLAQDIFREFNLDKRTEMIQGFKHKNIQDIGRQK